jgi:hypothetical protein
MMPDEKWYDIVAPDSPITQGDLIFRCPILSWNPANLSVDGSNEAECLRGAATAVKADVVIMSQACDLEKEKIENVILSPHISIQKHKAQWESDMRSSENNPTHKSWKKHCEDIRKGYMWNIGMINSFTIDTDNRLDVRLVYFDDVFSLPRTFLEKLLVQRGEQRLRLLPPYREHLSQAFSRFFMRVGLPQSIEKVWALQQ